MPNRYIFHNTGSISTPYGRYEEGIRCYQQVQRQANRLISESEVYADKAETLLNRAASTIHSSTVLFSQGVTLQNQADEWLQNNGALYGLNVTGCSALLQTLTTLEYNIINTYAPEAEAAINAAILAVSTLNAQTLLLNQSKEAYEQCMTSRVSGCGCGGTIPTIIL